MLLLSLLAYAVLCQLRNTDTFSTLFTLWFERKQRIHVVHLTQNSIHCLRSVDTLQNGARVTRRRQVISVFFAYKKYSRSFVKLRLNPWCHMDYFTDLLATFLDLVRSNYIAVYGRVRELSECIKKILICVPKMNEGLTGLEQHEGV